MDASFYALVVTLQLSQIALGATSKESPQTEHAPIKYPGPIKDISNRYGGNGTLEEPDACKGKRYCVLKPPGYPQERFNNMFKGMKKIPRPAVIVEESNDGIGDRLGETRGEDGCDVIISYKAPYQVRDESNNLRTVIQAPEHDFIQKVRLEECAKPKSPCFEVFSPEPGIEVFCEQKDVTWELMVALGDSYEAAKIPLPMCCSCKFRRV